MRWMGTIWDFGRLFPAAQAGEKEGKKRDILENKTSSIVI